MDIRASRSRPAFDPTLDFVTSKAITVNGQALEASAPFDKSQVSTRRLRLLYEQRQIQYAAGQKPGAAPAKPRAVGPTDIFNPGSCGHKMRPEDEAKPKAPARRAVSKRSVPRARSRRAQEAA